MQYNELIIWADQSCSKPVTHKSFLGTCNHRVKRLIIRDGLACSECQDRRRLPKGDFAKAVTLSVVKHARRSINAKDIA